MKARSPNTNFIYPKEVFFGEEIPVWKPQFRDKCQTCGTRMTCNGCSNCGACDSLPKKKPTEKKTEYDHTDLFNRLAKSEFRSRFYLNKKDKAFIEEKGLDTIRQHAADFIAKRLAPAVIPNDGSQTPMKHVPPVFQAQHATGCCCRGCFEK